MNTTFSSLTVELLVGFMALLVLTKVLGKTQITQLTPFDFISALVLGELVGNAIYDKEIAVHYVLYAVALWGALIMTIEKITQKWKGSRSLLEGKPSIVIHSGKIIREELRKNNLDLNQLQNLLRNKDVFSFSEVEYAILESNGNLNVLKKSPFQAATQADLSKPSSSVTLPMTIISDGEWVDDNIFQTPYSKDWFINLFNKNALTVNHIIIAEWSEGAPLYIQLNRAPFIKYINVP
ncbi:DUF421 domain-containing protein [Salipaludibacillus aurantiacus]|uniref:Uncharacterized membrane protein YcaP, DUF421 family n=1 Tax=Salipaludibacillus aurantiacus TaxID=1601833 RepID=A0A1H9PD76_9BACI|nr:DUF421 domain-containing protein [Salipaludibacillus aurantiacus]SER46224.1 Uncharacterized membrane protein YcaP, DUF421 family [Salipaludibacillus aurantiacus]